MPTSADRSTRCCGARRRRRTPAGLRRRRSGRRRRSLGVSRGVGRRRRAAASARRVRAAGSPASVPRRALRPPRRRPRPPCPPAGPNPARRLYAARSSAGSSASSPVDLAHDAPAEDHDGPIADELDLLELGRVQQDRPRPPRRGRAAARRSGSWCRCRCRAWGRSRASCGRRAATQRAMVTFCWLPPDRRRTSLPARASIWSVSTAPSTILPSPDRSMRPQLRIRAWSGRAMFSRTERCISRASARSAAT